MYYEWTRYINPRSKDVYRSMHLKVLGFNGSFGYIMSTII